jgi:hypothetical protein
VTGREPGSSATGGSSVRRGGGPAPAASGRIAVDLVVTREAITAVGLCSISLTSATITGVTAAAIGVPPAQNCEVTIAAVADATLAIASVRSERRRSSSRFAACEDIAARG